MISSFNIYVADGDEMEVYMNKIMKLSKNSVVCFLVVCAMLVTLLPANMASAAGATLSTKKVTIGIGKQTTQSFTIKNKVKNATYSYQSSDKKILKVDSKKGILTGVKAGTAKVTVKQTLKKKTTKVGTVTIKVVQTKAIASKLKKYTYGIETVSFDLNQFATYINPDATYQLVSSNKAIAANVTLTKSKKFAGKIKILKKGTITVTIKETYKKKTRTLGNFTIQANEPTFNTAKFLNTYGVVDLDAEFEPLKFMDYTQGVNMDDYWVESGDVDILEVDSYNLVRSVQEGTTNLSIYKGEKMLTSVSVTVKYVPVTAVKASKASISIYMGETTEECLAYFTFTASPEGANITNCNVVSSDEDVCSVETTYENNVATVEVYGTQEGVSILNIINAENQVLKTIKVQVFDSLNTIISQVKTSKSKVEVNADADEGVKFELSVLPAYGYVKNCILEVEDDYICSVDMDEPNGAKADIIVTGYNIGTTNIVIKNQEEAVLATIPVIVIENGYKEAAAISLSKTTTKIELGDVETIDYKVSTSGSFARYCIVSSEDPDICSVNPFYDEKTGSIEITAEDIGKTNIIIKNFSGKVLGKIAVTVFEE